MKECSGYKDSGAAWIGKIPCTWDVHRLKIHLKRVEEKNPGDMQVLSLYRELGIVPKDSRDDNHNVTSEDTSKYKYVKVGDFVVNKMKAWQGSVAVSDYEGIVSPAYYVYKFTDSNFYKRYFHYLLRSCYREEFMRLSEGIRIGQWDLSSGDLDNVPVLLPPMKEQKAIALYLDNTTKSIDDLISEAKASIEEYKCWKASIIHEAVTKGVKNHKRLKDSGILWIKEIPESWSVRKLKFAIFPLERPILDTDEVITCFRDGEVTLRKNRRTEGFTVSLTEHGYQGVEKGDLVIHGMDAFAGAIGCSECRGKITPVVHVCKTIGNNRFFMYALRNMAMSNVFMDFSNGVRIRSSDFRNFSKLGAFRVAIPPVKEQNEIVDYLDSVIVKIDLLLDEKQRLIDDLEAYKKSLIYEVVTGKRRVV